MDNDEFYRVEVFSQADNDWYSLGTFDHYSSAHIQLYNMKEMDYPECTMRIIKEVISKEMVLYVQ